MKKIKSNYGFSTIKYFFIICAFFGTYVVHSQNEGIAITTDGTDPDASAMLDVKSTSKGMLVPRLSLIQMGQITSPADGLLVYNTDSKIFMYYDDATSQWNEILKTGQESKWQGTGNIYYTGGNVGIGTSATPLSELTIYGGGGTNDAALTLDVDGTDWHVGIDDSNSDKLKIGTGSVVGTNSIMTIQNDGKIGIGTSTPLSELTIHGGSSTNDATLTLDVDGTDWHVGIDDSDGDKLKIGTGYSVGYNTWMTVQNDGKIGIGTASPLSELTIHGGTSINDAALTLDVDGTDWHVGIDDSDSDKLKIGTGNSVGAGTRITVQNNGNVGIGTTSPDATLQVNGTMKVFGAWLSRSYNTTYPATTDGFVVVGLKVTTTDFTHVKATGFTDSSSPPDTERGYAHIRYEVYGDNIQSSFTMPVRKGDYWKVEATVYPGSNPFSYFIYWIPLGVND